MDVKRKLDRQKADTKSQKKTKEGATEIKLGDLDSRIAALEAQLEESEDDTSLYSESDESSVSVAHPEELAKDSPNHNSTSTDAIDEIFGDIEHRSSILPADSDSVSDENELERIPPLPKSMLPRAGDLKSAVSNVNNSGGSSERHSKRPNRKSSGDGKNFKGKYCEICPKIYLATKEQWIKHKRDLIHRQNTVLAAGAAYEPSQNRSAYCRVCQVQFDTAEDFFKHRESEEHVEAAKEERRNSYCQICRKQFTSASQLQEHCKGKMHNEKVRGKKQQWRKSKRDKMKKPSGGNPY